MSPPPSQPTLYDEVPYPSALFPQTHPDRLATLAALFGLKPAPVERCRVLELGCGDGTNLIAMGFGLPQIQCYGIDLAARAIKKGNDLIAALDLKNVRLEALDLLETPEDLGEFDFVIAHGLYSWVPPEVRDRILAICGRHLAPQGVAYVSYNAYPGNHLRDLVRHVMRYHVEPFPSPAEKVKQARALIKFLAESKPEPGVWQQILRQESERIERYTDAGFFHDDLSPTNAPVYFHQFIEHASRHGLQYLAEADFTEMQADDFGESATAALQAMERGNIVAREQYLDFLKGRAFRQTLLCRKELRREAQPQPCAVAGLFVAADVAPVRGDAQFSDDTSEDFRGPKGLVIAASHPVAKAALGQLGSFWPRPVPFHELLRGARERAGKGGERSGSDLAQDEAVLAEFLIRGYAVGLVELHAHAPGFVTEVSERPVASRMARLLGVEGGTFPTLQHVPCKFPDALSRHLLRLLDGTNSRPALVKALGDLAASGAVTLLHEGKPVQDLAEAREILSAELEGNLRSLARLALLVG